MNKKRRQKIKDLFETARQIQPAEREDFLIEECGDDSELRQEIEKLLSYFDEDETSVLEESADKENLEKKTLALNQTTGEVATAGDFVAGTVLDNRYRIIG